MNILVILAPIALVLGFIALLGFIWAVKKGQYEDLSTPANRMLIDDEPILQQTNINKDNNLSENNTNDFINQEKGLKQ